MTSLKSNWIGVKFQQLKCPFSSISHISRNFMKNRNNSREQKRLQRHQYFAHLRNMGWVKRISIELCCIGGAVIQFIRWFFRTGACCLLKNEKNHILVGVERWANVSIAGIRIHYETSAVQFNFCLHCTALGCNDSIPGCNNCKSTHSQPTMTETIPFNFMPVYSP